MFAFSVSPTDALTLLLLFFIEGILSLDNALMLALIAKRLPPKKQKKALFIGTFAGVFLRILTVYFISHIIKNSWIQAVGGGYLLYLSLSHFFLEHKPHTEQKTHVSFLKTVIYIEVVDLMFAFDSILTAFGLVHASTSESMLTKKLWIVYTGALCGLFIVRFGANALTKILGRFAFLENSAYLIIGWVGLKFLSTPFIPLLGQKWQDRSSLIFWTGVVIIILYSCLQKQKKKSS